MFACITHLASLGLAIAGTPAFCFVFLLVFVALSFFSCIATGVFICFSWGGIWVGQDKVWLMSEAEVMSYVWLCGWILFELGRREVCWNWMRIGQSETSRLCFLFFYSFCKVLICVLFRVGTMRGTGASAIESI
ncbi:hypothetical protein QBC36DRAFT_337328 [Triangularia setosa]|uniref:Uncharacterized protein n=1 Tax=Triangularia setosa TaxID=2587417 RepID=A0AAN6VZV2_9PEZI|nr:hypothetical protein QBC36DRAFT_337328 [Podospora setosa]